MHIFFSQVAKKLSQPHVAATAAGLAYLAYAAVLGKRIEESGANINAFSIYGGAKKIEAAEAPSPKA